MIWIIKKTFHIFQKRLSFILIISFFTSILPVNVSAQRVINHYTEVDAATSPLGTSGWVQRFENGSIYFNTKQNRGWAVYGEISKIYEANNGSSGKFGFPLSNQYKRSDGQTCQLFEGGELCETSNKNMDSDILFDPSECQGDGCILKIVYSIENGTYNAIRMPFEFYLENRNIRELVNTIYSNSQNSKWGENLQLKKNLLELLLEENNKKIEELTNRISSVNGEIDIKEEVLDYLYWERQQLIVDGVESTAALIYHVAELVYTLKTSGSPKTFINSPQAKEIDFYVLPSGKTFQGKEMLEYYENFPKQISGIRISDHFIRRSYERQIDLSIITKIIENQSNKFEYYHRGEWKTGYYDSTTNTFIGQADSYTTIINNIDIRYINNLKNAKP